MSRKKPIIIISAVAICAAAAGAFAFGEERPAADRINDSALIIGTYLIDFEALNEENQALAEADARKNGQSRIYYKSELNAGVWYDITDAESVNDITLTNSRIVDNSVIDGLTLTLYFKADGSVVDFSTGKTVSKQDIEGQFDPANMPELSALVKQKEIVKGLADSTADSEDDESKEKHRLHSKETEVLDEVFKPIDDDACKELTKSLDALDSLMSRAEGGAKEAAADLKVKKRAELDNYCREKVAEKIDAAVRELINHDNAAHAELIGMLNDAQTELNASIADSASQMIGAKPTDAAGKKQRQLEEQIISSAENGDTEGAVKSAQTLSVLEAMINGESTDSKAAEELSDEMLKETMSGIEDTVSSILGGTHEYYGEGGAGMSAQTVLAQVQTDIADARQLAKDKAFYKTGSVSSGAYNEALSEDLSSLGLMLSALSESGGSGGSGGSGESGGSGGSGESGGSGGRDELGRLVISAVGDSAREVLSDAELAKALSAPATAEQKKIDDLTGRIDMAYDKYLDALNSGNEAAASAAMAQVQALEEQLGELRGDIAESVEELVGALFKEMSSDSPDEKKIRELDAQLSVDKDYLSDVDKALLEQALAAMEEMEDAARDGSVSKSEAAYDRLNTAVKNVPGELLSDSVKAVMLEYAASLLDNKSSLAAEGIGELLGEIMRDIAAAKNGDFTPDPPQAGNDPESGGNPEGGDPEGGSIYDDLYRYKLIVPSLNIYSNTMSIEKDGTVFVNMNAFSREAGIERFTSGEIYIFRGDGVLIELAAMENTAYVGDKLFAPSSPPYFSGKTLYAPADLVAAGLGLSVEEENGTVVMR